MNIQLCGLSARNIVAGRRATMKISANMLGVILMGTHLLQRARHLAATISNLLFFLKIELCE